MGERKHGEARLRNRQSGSWGTTSAMYFDVLRKVFQESKKAIAGDPSKPSRWVYAGLPVLIAGVESFLIEHQNLLQDSSRIRTLAGIKEIPLVLRLYPMPDEVRLDMEAVIEIRNHIVHPSPLPFGKPEWPACLQRLLDRQVLVGDAPQSGTDVLALLANHAVLEWAVLQSAKVLELVAASDDRTDVFRGQIRNLWLVLNDIPSVEGL
jgi:hypothetical protein